MITVRVYRVTVNHYDWMFSDDNGHSAFRELEGDYWVKWPHGLTTLVKKELFEREFFPINLAEGIYQTNRIPLFWDRISTPEYRARVMQVQANRARERREMLERIHAEFQGGVIRHVTPDLLPAPTGFILPKKSQPYKPE